MEYAKYLYLKKKVNFFEQITNNSNYETLK